MQNWSSTQTNLNVLLQNDTNLIYMPLVDTQNATQCERLFSSCVNLLEIPELNTANVYNMKDMFRDCNRLYTLPILNTSKVTSFQNTFLRCNKLSDESLNNVLKMCINAVLYNGTKTLAYLGLSTAQATRCQSLSNYSDFTAAGWTTGY